ncbi:hypothetical protein AMATHDRAFT_1355 [Amanita thiersii Skay4041]|uniref:Uncharacterized protein n=1 Tax=Amanita thiersii Skay4041 TaxID=703135 RepID=A0A2A9NV88_9AGAR|nr:hypothetical protein AMATHDRAFT_1355 [Amanita thiersii Skay4041]
MFSFIFFSLLFSILAQSRPLLPLKERDVVAPPVLSPNETSIWPIGTKQTVVWDTPPILPPEVISSPTNTRIENPLAQGFNITQGRVQVVVPNVPPRTDYIVVLMGDSGNASPPFAITLSGSPPDDSSTSTTSSESLITTPIPITGSSITGGSGETFTPSLSSPTTSVSTSMSLTLPATGTGTAIAASATQNGATSAHHVGAMCFALAMIVSGLLL